MLQKTISISNICNNRCLMCFVNKKYPEIPISRKSFREKLDAYYKENLNNFNTICLTGGEPTLNNDLFGILKDIQRLFRKAEITILSNGRMFAYGDYVDDLSRLNIRKLKIAVPLHAHRKELHDKVTQVMGSFRQTVKGIHNLIEKGFVLEIRIVINRINYKHLREIAKYIYENFSGNLYVVYIVMEIGESIFRNEAHIRYNEFMPYLEKALELKRNDIKVKLYHFPLCILNRKFHCLIYKSIEEYKLIFPPQCNICLYKKDCMGVLKTYIHYLGNKEFKPVEKEYE